MVRRLTEMIGGGRFLRATDLPEGKPVRVTIARVMSETVRDDDGERQKTALSFNGKEKLLLLNRTNAEVLIQAFTDDADRIEGQEVELVRTTAQFRGATVPAIRLRPVEVPQDQIPF